MHVRLRHLWHIVSSGYWFVPSVMTLAAAIGAWLLLYVDRNVIVAGEHLGWLYGGGADGAKTLLSTVAGSVITVAGVVFSITIAALTQASAQFGARLLRNFMRDTGNQVVLGTFVATFIYGLLILRTIHGKLEDGASFVPQASVTVAVMLSIADVAVLIYFIHHVSVSLQAPNVVAAVLADLTKVVDNASLRDSGRQSSKEARSSDVLPQDFEQNACPVASPCDGYLQAVDYDGLIAAASEADLVVQLIYRPGDYVIAGNTLLRAYPSARYGDALARKLGKTFIFGSQRTAEQDLEYAIRQLVEVAVRALSPGINDPFTAINCINALGSAICHIARSGLPGPCRCDAAGKLRLVTPVVTFDGITDAAFNQIRQYGSTSVAVTLRLLEVIERCAEQVTNPRLRLALRGHAEMTFRASQNVQLIPEERDRADAQLRWEVVQRALQISGH